MSFLGELLWSPKLWLPEGMTWEIMENDPDSDVYLPQARDMYWSVPLGLVFMLLRSLVQSYILTPLGYWLGVPRETTKRCQVMHNPVLEAYFKKNGKVQNNNGAVKMLCKQTDMPARDIDRWMRDRKKMDISSKIEKFQETGWLFIFYITSFIAGFILVWHKPYFWDTSLCWKGWPNLHVGTDIYLYYLIELSLYWCLLFSMFKEGYQKKDFSQMLVHHIATIFLMFFSWTMNFTRVGTLVLMTHDAADFPMAAAKMGKYAGYKRACEVFLYTFVVIWVISRLVYYPYVLLYTSCIELYDYVPPCLSIYFFDALLIVLQVLHLIWTYMIAKIAISSLKGNETTDVRSDDSDSD